MRQQVAGLTTRDLVVGTRSPMALSRLSAFPSGSACSSFTAMCAPTTICRTPSRMARCKRGAEVTERIDRLVCGRVSASVEGCRQTHSTAHRSGRARHTRGRQRTPHIAFLLRMPAQAKFVRLKVAWYSNAAKSMCRRTEQSYLNCRTTSDRHSGNMGSDLSRMYVPVRSVRSML